jgi:epoxyqueuosine reductase QueG
MMANESDILRIREIPGIPTAPAMVYGRLTDKHKAWVPEGSWRGAIVWGLPLPDDVVDELNHGPTSRYARIYEEWNRRLDKIAQDAEDCLRMFRIKAHAVSASKVIDRQHQRGEVSHRHLAALLGMGWIGKHGLLVTSQWGPALRLTTLLVDRPVEPSAKLPVGKCGSCKACIDACQVDALVLPLSPEKIARCWTLLKNNERDPDIGQQICGICIKACRDAVRNMS